MSRSFIGLAVLLAVILAGVGLSLARSGKIHQDASQRPGVSDRMRVAMRRHHHRVKAPVGSPVDAASAAPVSSQPASEASAPNAPLRTDPGGPVNPADTTPPNTTISSGPAASTTATAASFSFSSSESGSTFACKLDGGSWRNCSSPASYTALAFGTHQFSVRATDAAGNADASAATRAWTVQDPADTTAPNTTISSGPAASTTATAASFSFSSSESGSTFACKLDSGSWSSCASPSSYTALALGTHQFSVRATDVAGNTDATPASQSWTVSTQPPPPPPGCGSTVSSVSAAQSALSSAAPGATVCLADGTYGGLSLTSSKAAPGVTLTAAHPGAATIGSVSISGSGYTISRFVIDGGVTISRNTDRTVVDHNRILAGGHYGVFVCTAEPPDQCDDTAITGNVFDGPMNEDQIRANVFHDGDGDGVGLLVEGNEFKGNTERGSHNDVFQSVWVGDHLVFRKNYLHDFGGQGFFVKDQDEAINGFIANDNLIVDQDLPCEPSSLCTGYQLSPWQIYGPIANGEMRHNTVGWGAGGGTAVLTGTYTNINFSDNVFNRLSDTDGGGTVPSLTGSNNTYCDAGAWDVPPGSSKDCGPDFLNTAAGDYRQANGRGVDWTPAGQHYGP
ncbi:MAG TPA: hypothetical protein VGO13_05910 [Solirubrobacterales bacterium]|jgi:hypothetical protein|nr:hypothetical protein [Solirubrobacterales bacterium]